MDNGNDYAIFKSIDGRKTFALRLQDLETLRRVTRQHLDIELEARLPHDAKVIEIPPEFYE